jgi:hypothetical protein
MVVAAAIVWLSPLFSLSMFILTLTALINPTAGLKHIALLTITPSTALQSRFFLAQSLRFPPQTPPGPSVWLGLFGENTDPSSVRTL